MKRRNFILYSALTAATVSIPFMNCSGPDPELDRKLAIPETLARVYDENTIREIGLAYGKANPNEYHVPDLERLLLKTSEGKNVDASASDSAIHSTLEIQVKNDFNNGRSIILNGWVLSLTEARQCALYSLIPKK